MLVSPVVVGGHLRDQGVHCDSGWRTAWQQLLRHPLPQSTYQPHVDNAATTGSGEREHVAYIAPKERMQVITTMGKSPRGKTQQLKAGTHRWLSKFGMNLHRIRGCRLDVVSRDADA